MKSHRTQTHPLWLCRSPHTCCGDDAFCVEENCAHRAGDDVCGDGDGGGDGGGDGVVVSSRGVVWLRDVRTYPPLLPRRR